MYLFYSLGAIYIKFGSIFANVPIGAKTKPVTVAVKNRKTYTYKSDLTIKANEKIQSNLKEITRKDVEKLFQ